MFVHTVDEDDIEAVLKTAAHTYTPSNKFRPMNAQSSLPSSKAKLRIGIKKRMQLLAAAYISLATFIDDDELAFMEHNPKSKRTKAIYLKVIADMDKARKDMEQIKVIKPL